MTLCLHRKLLSATVVAAMCLAPLSLRAQQPAAAPASEAGPAQDTSKPNILVIFGDYIGQTNISA